MPGPVETPGVFVEEIPDRTKAIAGVATAITAFVGRAVMGPAEPTNCLGYAEFERIFGGRAAGFPLADVVEDFFGNGGRQAVIVRVSEAADLPGDPLQHTGIYALDQVDLFNLLCIPPDPPDAGAETLAPLYRAAADYCRTRRAMLILDAPAAWSDHARQSRFDLIEPDDLGISDPEPARNCAVYFPRIRKLDPATGETGVFPACGAVAGIFARTDQSRGVWHAPAGTGAGIDGITGLELDLTDDQSELLNPRGINSLRRFPAAGPVVWGTRTLRGADQFADDYKFIPVRRLALFLEESIWRGTKFAVFEPNAEPLWAQLQRSIDAFMSGLFRQGAFLGHFVKCDRTTTTLDDINRGIVNVLVGFAPIRPAEFVLLRFPLLAGQATL